MRLGLISTTKFRLLKTFTTSFFFFFLLEKVINRAYVIPTLTKNVTVDCIWRIKYDDGTTIWEKNPDSGEETLFKDIDQDKIKEIDLVNPIKELDDLLHQKRDMTSQLVKLNQQNTLAKFFKCWVLSSRLAKNRKQSIFLVKEDFAKLKKSRTEELYYAWEQRDLAHTWKLGKLLY